MAKKINVEVRIVHSDTDAYFTARNAETNKPFYKSETYTEKSNCKRGLLRKAIAKNWKIVKWLK